MTAESTEGGAGFVSSDRPITTPVETAEFDGELVIFNPADGGLHQLNRLGSLLWPFFDGSATVAELVDDAAAAFEMPRERVEADLLALLQDLRENHLLADAGNDDAAAATTADEAADINVSYLKDPPAP